MVKSEDAAVPTIHERVAPGSTIHADEAPHWDQFHARYLTNRLRNRALEADWRADMMMEAQMDRLCARLGVDL